MAEAFRRKIYLSRSSTHNSHVDGIQERLVKEGYLDKDDFAVLGTSFATEEDRRRIAQAIQQSEIVLVIITTSWLDQIQNPNARVYFEAETALQQDKLTIPVVVDMGFPLQDQLPEPVRDLVFRYGFSLSSDDDMAPILRFLQRDDLILSPRTAMVFPNAQGPKVYISYRWGDTSQQARSVPDDLRKTFGQNNIFLDVDDMQFGLDVRVVLQEVILTCDVMLAFIGQAWLDFGNDRRRRIQNPNDYVRIELEAGLRCGKRLVPILVDTQMPRAEALPESLRSLTERQAIGFGTELTIDAIREAISTAPPTKRGMPSPWGPTSQGDVVLRIAVSQDTEDAILIAKKLNSTKWGRERKFPDAIIHIDELGQSVMSEVSRSLPVTNLIVMDEDESHALDDDQVQKALSRVLDGSSYLITTRTDKDLPPNLYKLLPPVRSLALYPFVPLRVRTPFIDLDIDALMAVLEGKPAQPPMLVYPITEVNLRADASPSASIINQLPFGTALHSLGDKEETYRKVGQMSAWLSVQTALDGAKGYIRGDLFILTPPSGEFRPDAESDSPAPPVSAQVTVPPPATGSAKPAPSNPAPSGETNPNVQELAPMVQGPGAGAAQPRPSVTINLPTTIPVPVYLRKREPPTEDQAVVIEIYPEVVRLTWGEKSYASQLGKKKGKDLLKLDDPNVKTYGEQLFQALIRDDSHVAGFETTEKGFRRALDEKAKYWKIYTFPNEQLQGVMWEFLRDPKEQSPFVTQGYSLVRGFTTQVEEQQPAEKIKILVMLCNPADLGEERSENELVQQLAKLDLPTERAIIERALQSLKEQGVIEYKILARDEPDAQNRPTLDNLIALENDYDVLHILAHGVFIPDSSQNERPVFHLVIEQANALHKLVNTDKIKEVLKDSKIKLVLLASCESARIEGEASLFLGLAPILSRDAHIPAVIGMQRPLSVKFAQVFTSTFYNHLARSGNVEQAMTDTRFEIYRHDPDSPDWGLPVLIMHAEHAPLFSPSEEAAEQKIKAPLSREQIAVETVAKQIAREKTTEARPEDYDLLAKPQIRRDLDEQLGASFRLSATGLQNYITENSPILLKDLTYRQIAAALNTGKHIILIGAPGTGKTTLAQRICDFAAQEKLCTGRISTTATADWTTFDTVGGYVPSPRQTLVFRPGIFLEAIRTGKWLIIDELNRAEIDKAFGELFTVLSEQPVDLPYLVDRYRVRVLPPQREQSKPNQWYPQPDTVGYDYIVHPYWRIVATMNVYDRQFLFGMSLAFARRFAFINIDLPNKDMYKNTLLPRWLKDFEIRNGELLIGQLNMLLDSESALMKNRALGPAIVRDMLAYIGDRLKQRQKAPLLSLLGEAFLLYAVPQLDGLNQEIIIEIECKIRAVFKEQKEQADSISTSLKALYPHISGDMWKKDR